MSSNNARGKHPSMKLVGFASATVLTILAIFVILIDLQDRAAFTKVDNEINRIENEAISPKQATLVAGSTFAKGDGLLSQLSCLPDTKCPIIQKAWNVPTKDGEEAMSIHTLTEQTGYTIGTDCPAADQTSCSVIAQKNSFNTVFSIDKAHVVPAAGQDHSKTWKKLTVSVELK